MIERKLNNGFGGISFTCLVGVSLCAEDVKHDYGGRVSLATMKRMNSDLFLHRL